MPLCQSVAHHLWSEVAAAPLTEQTPLAELLAAAPAVFKAAPPVTRDFHADPQLADKLPATPPGDMIRLGNSDVWLLDRVDGTLGCHTVLTSVIPADGSAREVALPGELDPTDMCALSALAGATVDGVPALWIEQSGAFSDAYGQSTVVLAALDDEAFASPCEVTIDYAITDRVIHAVCPGLDCVPLIRIAETLAMRLRHGETAESLGVGMIAPDRPDDAAGYRRMAEISTADKSAETLPTFGVTLDTPYTAFADQLTFPLRLGNGTVYLARIGHGGFGWRETADTLLALYRLDNDRLEPAASVYIAARRSGITGVSISYIISR
jgi:hypothetical protein